jgi:segregation and condensation protein B
VEAALFMSPAALSVQELSGIIGIASIGHVDEMVKKLVEEYKTRDTALEIIEIDKKFMFALREPYASRVSRFASGPDISKGALRLLAYISKNNNALQSEVVKIFGGSTYDYVKELVEKGFMEKKKQGRSSRMSVTNKFKEYFSVTV